MPVDACCHDRSRGSNEGMLDTLDSLDSLASKGARRMIASALREEADESPSGSPTRSASTDVDSWPYRSSERAQAHARPPARGALAVPGADERRCLFHDSGKVIDCLLKQLHARTTGLGEIIGHPARREAKHALEPCG
jgi:hypothetical protein